MVIKTLLHHSIPFRSCRTGGSLSEPLRPVTKRVTATKSLAIKLEFTWRGVSPPFFLEDNCQDRTEDSVEEHKEQLIILR